MTNEQITGALQRSLDDRRYRVAIRKNDGAETLVHLIGRKLTRGQAVRVALDLNKALYLLGPNAYASVTREEN